MAINFNGNSPPKNLSAWLNGIVGKGAVAQATEAGIKEDVTAPVGQIADNLFGPEAKHEYNKVHKGEDAWENNFNKFDGKIFQLINPSGKVDSKA